MTGIRLEFTSAEKAKFSSMAKDFPNVFRRACGRAASGFRAQLRAVVRNGGGKYGVPEFEPLSDVSIALRPSQRMFGQLAQKEFIKMYKIDGVQYIGWLPRVAEWGSFLQEGENRPMEEEEIRYIRRFGHKQVSIYNRPERDVITPFTKFVGANYANNVVKIFEKMRLKETK